MIKNIKKTIAILLILVLLMPTLTVLAEIKPLEYELTLEEYLKTLYGKEELTDEFLATFEELSITEYGNNLGYGYENQVKFTFDILPKFVNLKRIKINHSCLKEFDMNLVANLAKLEEIELNSDSLEKIINLDNSKEDDNDNSNTTNTIMENVTKSNIITNNTVVTPNEINEYFKSLKTLKIYSDSEKFTKIKIDDIPTLETLSISTTYLEELNISNKLTNLEDLNISYGDWYNLDPEEYNIKSLEEIVLPSELTNLKKLRVFSLRLKKLEIPDELKKLTNIVINEFSDRSEYENLENLILPRELSDLQKLEIGGKNLKTLRVPEKAPKLEELTILAENFENFEIPTKISQNIKNLSLKVKSYKNLENIVEFENIENVSIGSNYMNSITIPEGFKKIKTLCIQGNRLEEINLPKDLKQLTTLEFFAGNYWGDSGNIGNIFIPKEMENLERIYIQCEGDLKTLEIEGELKKLKELTILANNSEKIIIPDNLINLERLSIDTDIKDLKIPNGLINLTYLSIQNKQVKEIQIPNDLANLIELHINNCDNLEKIMLSEGLTKLEYLNLSMTNGSIKEIEIPNTLSNIKNIKISSVSLEKIIIPETLTNLYKLYLSCDSLKELQVSNKLENLREVYLNCNNLEDFSILNELEKVWVLEIYNEKIEKLIIPESLKNVNSLKINSSNLKELEIISNQLWCLNKLEIYCSNLENVVIPKTLTKLKELSIYADNLNSLEIPDELTNLTKLTIRGEKIKELQISDKYTNLIELNINSDVLENLIIPGTLTNLREMYIGVKNIKIFEIPNTLVSLMRFGVVSDKIENIYIPEELINLSYLHIMAENLKTLEIPETLTKLGQLSLHFNSIEELDISKLNSIRGITIYAKKIKKLDLPAEFNKDTSSNSFLINGVELTENVLSEISSVKNLTELTINNQKSNINLNSLESLENLEKLIISCKNIEDTSVKSLSKLSHLTTLKIETIEDFDTSAILKLNRLQYLYVGNINIDDEDVTPPVIDDGTAVIRNDGQPIYIEESVEEGNSILYGFNFGEENSTSADIKESLDYSQFAEENDIENPSMKIVDKDDKELEQTDKVGTGDKIIIYDGEEVKAEFSVLYYGDVNGDGMANAIDSLSIIKNNFTKNGYDEREKAFKFDSDLYEEAGRIITKEKNIPGALDALAIVQQGFEMYTINQYKLKVEAIQ